MPDKAVSRYIIRGCFRVLAREWNNIIERDNDDVYGLRQIATTACVIIAEYYTGLRGEAINKIDIGVTLTMKHWKGSINHVEYPHVPLLLPGKFKKQTGLKWFSQPLS